MFVKKNTYIYNHPIINVASQMLHTGNSIKYKGLKNIFAATFHKILTLALICGKLEHSWLVTITARAMRKITTLPAVMS